MTAAPSAADAAPTVVADSPEASDAQPADPPANNGGGRGGTGGRGGGHQHQQQQQWYGQPPDGGAMYAHQEFGHPQAFGWNPDAAAFNPQFGYMHHHHHHHHHHFHHHHHTFARRGADIEVDEKSPEFCKALAKVAKPRPPWSIGSEPTNNIAEEIGRVEAFFRPTARDKQETGDVWEAVKSALNDLESGHQLQYTASNSWSFFPFRGRVSMAAPGVPDSAASMLSASLFKNGCRVVRELKDHRGFDCYLIEHAATGREVLLRVGESAQVAADTVRAIVSCQMSADVRAALDTILCLLRQSRIIDDLEPSTLSDEAVAVMVLSIANSYAERTPSDRLLIDFFLTYGFAAHFNPEQTAVSMAGMVNPISKSSDFAFDVLDPADSKRSLTPRMTVKKLQFMQSTFNYCYHVVSEFAKEKDPHKQRGQSPLSTVLGGEPFWPRVVELAQLQVEPYLSFVNDNRARAADEMVRQQARRSQQQQQQHHGRGGRR